ncbi:MFS transporter [Brevibacillus fulvus]|uniref:MFS family permease n=1 Tax=Brevibacillus fulvus TaxID=1125967 RepID=A0A938Y009_9BACL|nr:MFS transporter [Brevibacillus fulvus]MBM7590810.1 MFS family permease [Brevibacillus fulvus]
MNQTISSILHNRVYVLLLVVVFVMHLAGFLITPIFPILLKKDLTFSLTQIGLVLGVENIVYLAGSLLGGMLADTYGRRSVMVTGALTQAAAMLGFGISQTFWLFVLFAALNGFGLGFIAPALKAMITDSVTVEQRTSAFSIRGIAAHSGIILAGITLSWFAAVNQRLFFFSSLLFVLLALIVRITLREERKENTKQPIPLTQYKMLFYHRSFLLFSLITLLIWAFYAQFGLALPLRVENVLGSANSIGFIWTINSLSVLLLQGGISRFLLLRLNPYLSLLLGTLMLGVGIVGLGWSDRFAFLSASAVVFIIGEMILLPVLDSLTSYFAKDDLLGIYFGFANFIAGIGSAVGTSLGGWLIERLGGVGNSAPWVAFGLMTVLILALLGIFAIYAVPKYQRTPPTTPITIVRREKAE